MQVSKAAAMVVLSATLGCSAASDPSAWAGQPVPGTGGAGGGGTTVACPYPQGPYGLSQGSTAPPTLSWQGFAEGMSQSSQVSIDVYHDCDGSQGIDAVLFDVSATWCEACQLEASDLAARMTTFKGQGIHVVTLMIEDAPGMPATVATAQAWRTMFKLDQTATLADPAGSLVSMVAGGLGLPYQVVVDPRTMTITSTQEGYSGEYSALTSLAAKNHN
jgi:hypothetical protein